MVSLALFEVALSRVDTAFAGRAFAAYGGIYIASSLAWLRFVERTGPDWYDLAGSALCVLGAGVILFGSRGGVA